jgi:hypothetical protein
MRLSQNTEYAIVGALIVYTVFISPSLPAVRRFMGSAIGTVVGLGAVYWVAKNVSVCLALIVLAVVLRCSSGMVREGMEDCMDCPDDYTYDEGKKMCTKEGAASLPPICPPSVKPMGSTGPTGPK